MVNLVETTPLKEIDSPSPSSHQLSIAPHLKVGARSPSLFHVGMMIGLIFPRSYVGSHNYHEFISQGSCCVHVTSVLRNLWLLCSICTLFYNIPWILQGGDWYMSHLLLSSPQTLKGMIVPQCKRWWSYEVQSSHPASRVSALGPTTGNEWPNSVLRREWGCMPHSKLFHEKA